MPDPTAPRPVLLAIADISGYTRFMIANRGALTHAQALIGELIETIAVEIQIPLKVSKLEGDAIFLYGLVDEDPVVWRQQRDQVRERLRAFFQRFADKLAELSGNAICGCNACQNLDKLRLKLVVHAGECVIHKVAGFEELAGVDVIVVHRLLKNSVGTDEYALFTEEAWQMLGEPPNLPTETRVEHYDDVGDLQVRVWMPTATLMAARDRIALQPPAQRASRSVPWMVGFLFRAASAEVRPKKMTNLEVDENLPGGLVARSYVLLPLLAPIFAVMQAWHQFRKGS